MCDYGCKHSEKVQTFFEIETRGVDYVNNFFITFEFKESWAKDIDKMFFKVPKRQLKYSDYIVFFVYDKTFFVYKSAYLLNKYSFNNKYEHCCLRYTTILKNYFKRFFSYESLKKFIDEREK